MLSFCDVDAVTPSMLGLDADSSCCGSQGLFLTSSVGNHLLSSLAGSQHPALVPMSHRGKAVRLCLPRLPFPHVWHPVHAWTWALLWGRSCSWIWLQEPPAIPQCCWMGVTSPPGAGCAGVTLSRGGARIHCASISQ